MICSNIIRNKILEKIEKYYKVKWKYSKDPFIPRKTLINYSTRVFNEQELLNLVESALDFQLTDGKFIKQFEKELSEYLNVDHSLLVNSGSSANYLAFMTLTSPELEEKRITRNSEIITTALAFPTTVSPIINYGAIPVFVDVDIETANIKIEDLEKALSKNTKAVFIAHTLGTPFNIEEVEKFCNENGLWLISDCCDSLGSKYKGKSLEGYGHISTSSFYPAHHITTGHGGAIYTNHKFLYRIAKSFATWGRDFKCDKCIPDCRKRYENNYDCRYEYSHFGFNFQPTEMQAAIGLAQLKKLEEFTEKRIHNYMYLYNNFIRSDFDISDYFIFQHSEEHECESSPFAMLLTVEKHAPFNRLDIVKFLEEKKIETRFLFAGNILKQKCFEHLKENIDYRVVGNLENTDYMMDNSFFIGCYPGLEDVQLDYIIECFEEFIKKYK